MNCCGNFLMLHFKQIFQCVHSYDRNSILLKSINQFFSFTYDLVLFIEKKIVVLRV